MRLICANVECCSWHIMLRGCRLAEALDLPRAFSLKLVRGVNQGITMNCSGQLLHDCTHIQLMQEYLSGCAAA